MPDVKQEEYSYDSNLSRNSSKNDSKSVLEALQSITSTLLLSNQENNYKMSYPINEDWIDKYKVSKHSKSC